MDDIIILSHLKKNAKDEKVCKFVCEIFMMEFNNEPWYDRCESILDKYIEVDENEN